ncbi:MAG: hypothetical protein LQ338_001459 [Usnochroma carphineum]|nr:MAG: hypothetical protein LQ338_001459 [Usnochroma carphineum]
MPGHGYHLQVRNFLMSVSHSVGASDLTWGMWTIVLTGMNGYVQAYPGYDFQFEIRLMQGEEIEGQSPNPVYKRNNTVNAENSVASGEERLQSHKDHFSDTVIAESDVGNIFGKPCVDRDALTFTASFVLPRQSVEWKAQH